MNTRIQVGQFAEGARVGLTSAAARVDANSRRRWRKKECAGNFGRSGAIARDTGSGRITASAARRRQVIPVCATFRACGRGRPNSRATVLRSGAEAGRRPARGTIRCRRVSRDLDQVVGGNRHGIPAEGLTTTVYSRVAQLVCPITSSDEAPASYFAAFDKPTATRWRRRVRTSPGGTRTARGP